jgi:cell wall-associated NlpC family hydrolase
VSIGPQGGGGMGAKAAAVAAGALLMVLVVAAGAGAGFASILGGGDSAPSAVASSQIPAAMLALYQTAAVTCPGLPWTVLAAIGTIESGNGTSNLPGVHAGTNSAGAEGPMQFEPATFATYAMPVPVGGEAPPSPYDATDAVYAAARMLCANGASGGAGISAAIFDYNHSAAYVSQVLALAASYGQTQAQTVASGTAGGIAADWALAQVGTPYIWGGETPGVGFDCSGLVQAAYKAAGVTLPRVAQDQFNAGPLLALDTTLEPGDLVFFGASTTEVSHVGIYVGNGQMVDAPHTGADVRVESIPIAVGAKWGNEIFVGATQP